MLLSGFAKSAEENLPRIALSLGPVHAPDGSKIALMRRYVNMRMVRSTLAHFACAILLLTPIEEALFAQAEKYEGKPILTIQFDPKEQPLEAAELHDILPLRKDEPLRMVDVRASVERLFATGRYADIQVDAQPYQENGKDGVII